MNIRPYIISYLKKGPASSAQILDEVKMDCIKIELKDVLKELSKMANEELIDVDLKDLTQVYKSLNDLVKNGLYLSSGTPIEAKYSLKGLI